MPHVLDRLDFEVALHRMRQDAALALLVRLAVLDPSLSFLSPEERGELEHILIRMDKLARGLDET